MLEKDGRRETRLFSAGEGVPSVKKKPGFFPCPQLFVLHTEKNAQKLLPRYLQIRRRRIPASAGFGVSSVERNDRKKFDHQVLPHLPTTRTHFPPHLSDLPSDMTTSVFIVSFFSSQLPANTSHLPLLIDLTCHVFCQTSPIKIH